MILVKVHSPSSDSLASANGLAQFFQCFSRAIAPALVRYVIHPIYGFFQPFLKMSISCLFAYSTEHNLLGGHLWMVLMLLLSILSWVYSLTLPEEDTPVNADMFDTCEVI